MAPRILNHSKKLEACFSPQNPNIQYTPLSYCWGFLPLPAEPEKVNFVEGLKNIGGPTHNEGLAVHMYAANTRWGENAFVNNDGDFLIILQIGRLDIQTELGR
jgi:homogentisate 1,2-dioxygenase